LVDWVFGEYEEGKGYFSNLSEFKKNMKEKCKSLAFMQDITNGTKHRSITRYTPTIKDTQRHKGAFSSGFSKAFDVSCLKLIFDDGTAVYFDEEIDKVRTFWEDYFINKLGEIV
ncbi:unnamed protein product, partial [marine sediment metagenome]